DTNAPATNQVGVLAEEIGPSKTFGALTVSELRSRPTSSGATVAGGYLTITNTGAEADRLIRAASPRATRTELHEMAMDGNMMTMRPVTSIEVPANGSVKLEPGGFHIMFLDIPKPFAANETIPVSLTFERAGQIDVELIVGVRAGQSGPVSDHGSKK
ncbi:MAG: copper chaperone PCu(A)C, partial [bacterium]